MKYKKHMQYNQTERNTTEKTQETAEEKNTLTGTGEMSVCLLSLFYPHGVHPYEKCDYK